MLAVLADGWKLTVLVILKRKYLPKEKFPSGITFTCDVNGG
jgi:hypothetical protein